jgi:hypothetical protein
MKITLTVTGGFTGVGGKWEIEAGSDATQRPAELQHLVQLIDEARSAGVFENDYSIAPPHQGPTTAGRPADEIIRDQQTYELTVNGERVRWCEPALASATAVPSFLRELKQRIMRSAPRQPYPGR